MARRMYPSQLTDPTDPAEICRMLESWADLGENERMPNDVTAILAMYGWALECQDQVDRVEQDRDALYRAMDTVDRGQRKWIQDAANVLAERMSEHPPALFDVAATLTNRQRVYDQTVSQGCSEKTVEQNGPVMMGDASLRGDVGRAGKT